MAMRNRITCERCHKPAVATMTSMFNTQTCCMDCIETEQRHPRYEEARKAELDAVRRGDYNFPGIGRPTDL